MDDFAQSQTSVERDSMGTIQVPANVYWGAQTARSLIHFKIRRDDKAAEIAHTAYQDGSSLPEACLKLGYLRGEEFDGIVRPAASTHP